MDLKNTFREEVEHNEAAPPEAVANESAPRGRVLIRGGRQPGKLLGPDAAPLVSAPPAPPEARFLKVGDQIRALGFVYVVRKVTKKDVVLRPVRRG